MKFLHAADLHLDSPLRAQAARDPALSEQLRTASRRVLERLVDAAIAGTVDAVLFAGDTFDNGVGDVASRAALAAQIARLGRAGIPAVMIQGNHDALLDLDRYGPVAENLTLLTPDAPTIRIGGAAIHGLGFTAPHVAESLLPRYPAPEPDTWNIGLMHTSLDGAAGHDPYAPTALADLLRHGYDYWALGHIHKRSEHRGERSLAVMPGIPQGRHAREMEGGSATLVEIDLQGVRTTPAPLELLRFLEVEVDLEEAEDQAMRDVLLRDALGDAASDDLLIAARVRVVGTAAELGDPDLLTEQARQAAEGIDGLHVESVRVRAVDRGASAQGAEEDLAALMREDAASPGFRDEVQAAMTELRDALPREIRDIFEEDALDTLIADGIETMALRLAVGRDGH